MLIIHIFFQQFYSDHEQTLVKNDFELILCKKLIEKGLTNICSLVNNVLRFVEMC